MPLEKRMCGRPSGSGKDDTHYLIQVANVLVADPTLKPTTAMKRVIRVRTNKPETDETLLRRLQVKWKQDSVALLAAACERARPKPQRQQPNWSEFSAPARTIGEMIRDFARNQQHAQSSFQAWDAIKKQRDLFDVPWKTQRLHSIFEQHKRLEAAINPPGLREFFEHQRLIEKATRFWVKG